MDETTKLALIIVAGVVVTAAMGAGVYVYVNRDKNPEITNLNRMAASEALNDALEVQRLRAAAVEKSNGKARATARAEYPHPLLDGVALRAV